MQQGTYGIQAPDLRSLSAMLLLGRGRVCVNTCLLLQGDATVAPHLSLLEFGSARLLLLANPLAVCRGMPRQARRAP